MIGRQLFSLFSTNKKAKHKMRQGQEASNRELNTSFGKTQGLVALFIKILVLYLGHIYY